MKNKLRQEIEGKFSLNEIQKKATEKVGKNLIIDAPTASGKTEAILLSIPEGSKVTWMLPTITSCTFMYRRLCHDFQNLNVRVNTSTLTEERIFSDKFTTINIITCDPLMVSYIKSLVTDGEHIKTTDEVLVLDEIDNYPTKVRTALHSYLNNVELDQVILASATLDENLKSVGNFETIRFSHISNKIRYKYRNLHYERDIAEVVKENYKSKKIGIILNCISDMDDVMEYINDLTKLNRDDMNIIFHHSNLPNEIKLENEKRLFEGDYDLLISNDLISMSIDVDLDLLIMGWSDKLNINIQRMGRLNRRNKKVDFENLYIYRNRYPGFIYSYDAEELCSNLGISDYSTLFITNDIISEWSKQIVLDHYLLEDLLSDVRYTLNKGEEVLLRDIPMTFRYQAYEVKETRKKGKKISAERKIMTIDKRMRNIPFDRDDPCSKEDGLEKDILYMPWMYDMDHPSGDHSCFWRIENYDQESGVRTIAPYSGPRFKYWEDREEDFGDDDEEFTDSTHDESGAFTAKGGWYKPNIIFNEKNEKFMSYPEYLAGYDIDSVETLFEKDYNEEERSILLGVIRDFYNKLLHFSKGFSFKDCNEFEMMKNGTKIINYFAKENKMNPVTLLKESCYIAREYGLDPLKSQQAALALTTINVNNKFLGYNFFWLALYPELKKIFIQEFEPKIRKKFGNLDYDKIKLEYKENEEVGDIPTRFTYEDLSYDIPKLFIQDVWIGTGE